MPFRRITIIKPLKKEAPDLNSALQVIGGALGLFSLRDKDKSCFRIFIELLKSKRGISSEELARRSGLTRGTVVFHLNKLITAGIVETSDNRYFLTVGDLESLISKVESDIIETLNDLKEIAREVDRKLNR